MTRRLKSVALLAGLGMAGALSLPRSAMGHHSFAMFDSTQTLTAAGTVKEWQWGNPHTWLEIIVQNPDNTEKSLSLELTGLSGLRRNGWRPGTLKPGDKITVTFHPMRDGTPAGELVQAVLGDGQTLKAQ